MIGDPLALRIYTSVGRATPEQVAAVADAQQVDPAMRFAGVAVTAAGGPCDNLVAVAALDYGAPGDVLVLANRRDRSAAVIGDQQAAVAKREGVAGIVTDGIRAKGSPTFSCGVRPNGMYRNGPGELNESVSIGDVVVQSRDVVVGSRARADRVIADGADVQAKEDAPDGRIAHRETTTLWDRSRYLERGVEEL